MPKIIITINNSENVDIDKIKRNFLTNSSCGVCGKTSLESLEIIKKDKIIKSIPKIHHEIIMKSPDILRKNLKQLVFSTKKNEVNLHSTSAYPTSLKEPFFALFYSYYLGTDQGFEDRRPDEWVGGFINDVYEGMHQDNPFNTTKFSGLNRWYSYAGLGWYDGNIFQANPYERIKRSLPKIFSGKSKKKLDGEKFIKQIGALCPELDGGEIFIKGNKYRPYNISDKKCSSGLSHALVELHEDKVIKLYCPGDSQGWYINKAEPIVDDTVKHPFRIQQVEYLE